MNRRTLLRILAAVIVAPAKLVMTATRWRPRRTGPLTDVEAAFRSDFVAPPIPGLSGPARRCIRSRSAWDSIGPDPIADIRMAAARLKAASGVKPTVVMVPRENVQNFEAILRRLPLDDELRSVRVAGVDVVADRDSASRA